MHTAAALAILAGVSKPLMAQNGGVITGVVKNAATGSPVANAKVHVVSERRSYVTGGDGTYRLTVDSVRVEVRVTAVGFAPVTQIVVLNASVGTIVTFELQPSAVPLDEVVTLGTRAIERTGTQSAVPIDVISTQMMENTGVIETWQQLQRLLPSVFGPHIPFFDNGVRPITLRGLAPHHSLLLVNGKRRHPAATLLSGPSVPFMGFTDINAIPTSAIDHVEVLRDGASAQYGSDAIGGVVNVVLKSRRQRDLRASVGQVFSSEGGRTFHDGRVLDAAGGYGAVSNNGSHVTLAGEFRNRGGTNRAYPDMRPQYFPGDPRNNEPARISGYVGDGELRDLSFFIDAAAPISSATEVYAFGGAAQKNNLTPDPFFRRPLDPRTVRAIFPNGFLPRTETNIGDISGVAGIRGSIHDWRWDLSSVWGDDRVSYHVENSNNVSLGAASPTRFYIGRVSAQQWTSSLDISRDATVASIPVTLATGMEFRVETYQIRAGDADSWRDGGVRILDGPLAGQPAPVGAQAMLGFRPVDEVSPRRSNTAVYLETDGRLSQRLLVQSAVRAERYSDFGPTYDGKLAGRVQALSWLAARGSVTTGFRAPSLTQAYFSGARVTLQTVNGVNSILTRHTFPVNTYEAQLMGAKPLRPEKSVSLSAGVVLNKASLPFITADLYQVKINDRTGLVSAVTDTALIRVFEENGLRGIDAGDYFANMIDTRTRGVDIVVSHGILLTRTGVLQILGGYNYNKTLVTHVAPPPSQIEASGSVRFNRLTRGIIEQGQPRQTITLGLDYSAGPLGLNLHNQHSGPTAQLDLTNPDLDEHVSAKWVTDVRASYRLRSRLEIALCVANLFDVYPPEWKDYKNGVNATGVSMQGIFRYPGALSAVGENGRTVYLQLSYR
ncbi:MAG: TonB-dependent receptor [Gemmatimonadales bacterium]